MEKTSRRSKTSILSLLTVLLCTALVFLSARMEAKERGFPLGDFSGVDAATLEAAYGSSGDTDELIYLLKVLCYRAEVDKDPAAPDLIVQYGTVLLDRAKDGDIDLETLGDQDETLLEMLKLIRSYGAK